MSTTMTTSTNELARRTIIVGAVATAACVMSSTLSHFSEPFALNDGESGNGKPNVRGTSNDYQVADMGLVAAAGFVAPSNYIDRILDRPTTERELAVAKIRDWRTLGSNWDGEGALAPALSSLREASDFVRLLPHAAIPPEPMLHATGRAGLFWNENGAYADLEFMGDGRVAYFVKYGVEKAKGVASFDRESIPRVLTALLDPAVGELPVSALEF